MKKGPVFTDPKLKWLVLWCLTTCSSWYMWILSFLFLLSPLSENLYWSYSWAIHALVFCFGLVTARFNTSFPSLVLCFSKKTKEKNKPPLFAISFLMSSTFMCNWLVFSNHHWSFENQNTWKINGLSNFFIYLQSTKFQARLCRIQKNIWFSIYMSHFFYLYYKVQNFGKEYAEYRRESLCTYTVLVR